MGVALHKCLGLLLILWQSSPPCWLAHQIWHVLLGVEEASGSGRLVTVATSPMGQAWLRGGPGLWWQHRWHLLCLGSWCSHCLHTPGV